MEGIVKQLAAAGDHDKITAVIKLLTVEFTYSPQSNHRKVAEMEMLEIFLSNCFLMNWWTIWIITVFLVVYFLLLVFKVLFRWCCASFKCFCFFSGSYSCRED